MACWLPSSFCTVAGGLVAVIVQQEDSRWWTYPYIMLLTLGITRWREPGAQRYHRDAQTASP